MVRSAWAAGAAQRETAGGDGVEATAALTTYTTKICKKGSRETESDRDSRSKDKMAQPGGTLRQTMDN